MAAGAVGEASWRPGPAAPGMPWTDTLCRARRMAGRDRSWKGREVPLLGGDNILDTARERREAERFEPPEEQKRRSRQARSEENPLDGLQHLEFEVRAHACRRWAPEQAQGWRHLLSSRTNRPRHCCARAGGRRAAWQRLLGGRPAGGRAQARAGAGHLAVPAQGRPHLAGVPWRGQAAASAMLQAQQQRHSACLRCQQHRQSDANSLPRAPADQGVQTHLLPLAARDREWPRAAVHLPQILQGAGGRVGAAARRPPPGHGAGLPCPGRGDAGGSRAGLGWARGEPTCSAVCHAFDEPDPWHRAGTPPAGA